MVLSSSSSSFTRFSLRSLSELERGSPDSARWLLECVVERLHCQLTSDFLSSTSTTTTTRTTTTRTTQKELDTLVYIHRDTLRLAHELLQTDRPWQRFQPSDQYLIASTFTQIAARHATTIETVVPMVHAAAAAAAVVVKVVEEEEQCCHPRPVVGRGVVYHDQAEQFLQQRLGIQLLCHHSNELLRVKQQDHRCPGGGGGCCCGAIGQNVSLREYIDDAITEAKHIVEAHLLVCPDVLVVVGPTTTTTTTSSTKADNNNNNNNGPLVAAAVPLPVIVRATFVPSWLQHSLVELLKNAMAAVVKQHHGHHNVPSSDVDLPALPPLELRVFYQQQEQLHHHPGENDDTRGSTTPAAVTTTTPPAAASHVVIEIVDAGTGLDSADADDDDEPPHQAVFRIGHTSHNKRWDRLNEQQSYAAVRSPLSSLGVGLPVARYQTEHFGGTLTLRNNHHPSPHPHNHANGRGCTARLELPLDDTILERIPGTIVRIHFQQHYHHADDTTQPIVAAAAPATTELPQLQTSVRIGEWRSGIDSVVQSLLLSPSDPLFAVCVGPGRNSLLLSLVYDGGFFINDILRRDLADGGTTATTTLGNAATFAAAAVAAVDAASSVRTTAAAATTAAAGGVVMAVPKSRQASCRRMGNHVDVDHCYPLGTVKKFPDPACAVIDNWAAVQRCLFGRYEYDNNEDMVVGGGSVLDKKNQNRTNHVISVVHILGERHSGTKFITEQVQACFPKTTRDGDGIGDDENSNNNGGTGSSSAAAAVPFKIHRDFLRSKHFFQPIFWTENYQDRLILVVVRDPYEWVAAMRERPYHAPNHVQQLLMNGTVVPLPWSKFVARRWTTQRSVEDEGLWRQQQNQRGRQKLLYLCRERFRLHEVRPCRLDNVTAQYPPWNIPMRLYRGFEPLYEHNGRDGQAYQTLLDLRRDKLINWILQIPLVLRIGAFLVVRYEDVLENGTGFLIDQIAAVTGRAKSDQCRPAPPQPNRLGRRPIPDAFRKWIRENLHPETERLVGY